MNEHEAARIASAVHHLRPDWPVKSILTLLLTKLADRPRRDVCVALAWVACESNTATPARVLEQGPWWRAAAVDSAPAGTANTFDRATCCGICSQPERICQSHARPDHEFIPHALYMQRTVPTDPRTPTSTPPETEESSA
jgi:hypothetical protein